VNGFLLGIVVDDFVVLFQSLSVDVCVDCFFCVFHNACYAFIDVKEQ